MGRAGPATTVAAALVVVLGATGFLLSQAPPRRPPPTPRRTPADSLTPFLQSAGAIAFGREVTSGSPTFDRTRTTSVALPGSPARAVYAGTTCCLSWSPDGGRLLLTTLPAGGRTGEVVIAVNRDLTQIRDRRFQLGPGAWANDGRRLAVWAADPIHPERDGIYLWGLDGHRLARLTRATRGRVQRPLGYSPDGRRLLVYEEGPIRGQGTLATVLAAGGPLHPVNPPGTRVRCCFWGPPASWSPDGRISYAAFTGPTDEGRSAVWVASADGGMGQPIAPWGGWTTSARWSPDGRWIVFDQVSRAGGAHDLFLVHPDGTGLRRLPAAAPGVGACCARWSPDGRALVYERGPTDDRLRLWLLNIDGSGARPMTGPAAGFTFAWGR